MTIELALCILIVLFGVGVYQALVSVDFKPLQINIVRRPKVIENVVCDHADRELAYDGLIEDYNNLLNKNEALEAKSKRDEESANTWHKAFESAIDDHDRTRCKYGLEPIGHNIKPEEYEYEIEDVCGNIYYRTTWTASNSSQYASKYLDYVERVKLNKDTTAAIKSAQQMLKASGWDFTYPNNF